MTKLIKPASLTIKVYSFDDLDKVLKKINELNEKVESGYISGSIGANIEVDLKEIHETKNDIPPIYKMRLALSEALQDAANGLRYVPEDSVNGKRYDLLESRGNYTDRPECKSVPCPLH